MLNLSERIRASPYYPALVHPVFRRVLPGAAASALGDGMSAVAIAWLALELAPADSRGLWVGAAVAAYTLPGAVGAIVLRRWLHGRPGTGLVIVNAVLRAAALGLAGCLALAGPIGTAFGGPLVAALGARGTLLASALTTIALGLITTGILVRPVPAVPDSRPYPPHSASSRGCPDHRIPPTNLLLIYLNLINNKLFPELNSLTIGCPAKLVSDRIRTCRRSHFPGDGRTDGSIASR